MAFFTNITTLLVLACISHQMMMGSCQKGNGRRGRTMDRGQNKDRAGLKVGRQQKSTSAQPIKRKLVTKDKSECTWAVTGEEIVILSINCRKGDRNISCDYTAVPAVCPQYASNTKRYWKQIAKALKKQNNLCQDSGQLVRAGMCKQAARDAHFRLSQNLEPHAPRPAPTAAKSCRPSNEKLAEEYCNDSWTSFCTFFFTMVQNNDC